MKMEETDCSETSAHKIQTQGNNLYLYKYPSNLLPIILPAYTTYKDGTNCSETSAHKIQTPGNNLYLYKYPSRLVPVILPAYTTYEYGTECSETSAHKIQTAGNHPKERIQHSEHGESLKSRENCIYYYNFSKCIKPS
jgi:hypothetical protein